MTTLPDLQRRVGTWGIATVQNRTWTTDSGRGSIRHDSPAS